MAAYSQAGWGPDPKQLIYALRAQSAKFPHLAANDKYLVDLIKKSRPPLHHDGSFHQGLPATVHAHEATVDQRSGKSLQSGPRGGTFHTTSSGTKVYEKG